MKFCPECERDFSEDIDVCPTDGARLVFFSTEEDLLLGKTIEGRYTLERRVGEGGMGAVYVATQKAVGRKVAVKVLRRDLADDPGAVKRFFHEAKVVSRLRHPNTITLYDFGQSEEGLLYIAMEYMTGRRLDALLEEGDLTLREILEIMDQVCQSLAEAHDAGIVHRDLKPENVFIDAVGNRRIVKVLDFGIAKVQGLKSNLTLTGMVFGTPAYMSPEQAQGFELDRRTDIYSLGVLLYELLCGRLPYHDESAMRLAMKHILDPIPDVADHSLYRPLPDRLRSLVTAMLSKRPEGRPDSADDVRAVVLDVLREIEAYPPAALLPSPPPAAGAALAEELGEPSGEQSEVLVAVRERKAEASRSTPPPPPEQTGPNSRIGQVYTTSEYSDLVEQADTDVHDVPARRPFVRRLAAAAAILVVGTLVTLLVLGLPPFETDRGATSDRGTSGAPEPTAGQVAAAVPSEATASPTSPSAAEGVQALVETPPRPAAGLSPDVATHVRSVIDHGSEAIVARLPGGTALARDVVAMFRAPSANGNTGGGEGDVTPPVLVSAAVDVAAESVEQDAEPGALDQAMGRFDLPESVSIRLNLRPTDAEVRLVGSDELLCDGDACSSVDFPWGIEPVEIQVSRRRYQDEVVSIVPDHEQEVDIRLERVPSRVREEAEQVHVEPLGGDEAVGQPPPDEEPDASSSPLMTPVTIPH